MRSIKILHIFIFLFVLALSAVAQTNPYPNELSGYEFYRSGRLKDLKPLVSTKADVIRVMGSNCENNCDYDDNWTISFAYVGNGWTRSDGEHRYKARPEFAGKLHDISFQPKHPIVLSSADAFPIGFECANGQAERDHFEYKCRVCIDSSRVIYSLSAETKSDGTILVQDRQLMNIGYLPTKKDEDAIYTLVEK